MIVYVHSICCPNNKVIKRLYGWFVIIEMCCGNVSTRWFIFHNEIFWIDSSSTIQIESFNATMNISNNYCIMFFIWMYENVRLIVLTNSILVFSSMHFSACRSDSSIPYMQWLYTVAMGAEFHEIKILLPWLIVGELQPVALAGLIRCKHLLAGSKRNKSPISCINASRFIYISDLRVH